MSDIVKKANSQNLGRGHVTFQETGKVGELDFQEIDEFSFNISVDRVQKYSNRNLNTVKTFDQISQIDVAGSMSITSTALEIARFFNLAKEVVETIQSSGSFSSKTVTAKKHKWIDLGKQGLTEGSVKVFKNGAAVAFTADNSTNTFTSSSHGLSDGDSIEFQEVGTLPAGLTAGTIYYIISSDTNTFKVSLTKGGSEVAITDDGTGSNTYRQRYIEDTDYGINYEWGSIHIANGGGISADEVLAIEGSFSEITENKIEGVTKSDIEGKIRFYGKGNVRQYFEANVKIFPDGDFALISTDVQVYTINFEAVKKSGEELYIFKEISNISVAGV